jgi:hypothetical protein
VLENFHPARGDSGRFFLRASARVEPRFLKTLMRWINPVVKVRRVVYFATAAYLRRTSHPALD